jgi:hypothetical protein
VSAAANQPPPDIDALEARLLRRSRSGTPRSSSATRRSGRTIASRVFYASFNERSSAADPRSSIRTSSPWRWRTSNRWSRPARRPTTSRTRPLPPRGWRSAGRAAARYPLIFRAFTSRSSLRTGTAHPTQICVPRLRGGRGSGAGARAADQGRPTDRGDDRLRAGVRIRLASAALSSGPDAGRPGPRHQALDAGFPDWLRGLHAGVRLGEG